MLSIPPWGARGDAGPLPEQGTGPGPLVWRDGDDSPRSRVGSLPSSEVEMIRLPEGRLATLERDGDHPAGPRGVRMGRVLGFFESLSFFQIGNEAVGLRGLSCLIYVCVFRVVLVPRLGCP